MTDQAQAGLGCVLDEAQRNVVIRFGAEVERLWHTPVAGQGKKRTLLHVENDFDWSSAARGQPPPFRGQTVTAPTDDALAAMQMQFRVFVLEEETTHFLSVRKLVSRALHLAQVEDPGGFVKAVKAGWKLPLVTRLGCPVPGQDLIDWWFNGERFHRDEDKQAKLDAIRTRFGEGRLRIWLMMAFTLAQAVLIEFHMFLRDRTDLYQGAPWVATA